MKTDTIETQNDSNNELLTSIKIIENLAAN